MFQSDVMLVVESSSFSLHFPVFLQTISFFDTRTQVVPRKHPTVLRVLNAPTPVARSQNTLGYGGDAIDMGCCQARRR